MEHASPPWEGSRLGGEPGSAARTNSALIYTTGNPFEHKYVCQGAEQAGDATPDGMQRVLATAG
jgi:hypothetical protein